MTLRLINLKELRTDRVHFGVSGDCFDVYDSLEFAVEVFVPIHRF